MADEENKVPKFFKPGLSKPVVPEVPKVEVKKEPVVVEKPKVEDNGGWKKAPEPKPVVSEKPKVENRKDVTATLTEIEEVANKGLVFGKDRRQALRDVATLARRALGKE